MSGRPAIATVLSTEERDKAKALGADIYTRSLRYKRLRGPMFEVLDKAVESLRKMKFPNPYDGDVLSGLAAAIVRFDRRAIGYLRKRKVEALDTDDRKRLFEYLGAFIAEDFLYSRKQEIPADLLLASPDVTKEQVDELFEAMRAAGQALEKETVAQDDLLVTLPGADSDLALARGVIEEAVKRYEAVLPPLDPDSDVPSETQRRSISRAAFLQLTADELSELVTTQAVGEALTKAELVAALTEKYGDDIDEVARLVIKRKEGDPRYGLVTRLIPLREPPDLDVLQSVFESLRDHYFEVKAAVFFLFGDVERLTSGALRVSGRVQAFSVAATEVGHEVRMTPRKRTQHVTMLLRPNDDWVEVSVRRATDLDVMRTVLRRTGEAVPIDVVPPDSLTIAPYDTWDSRTVWMLDFLRSELQAPELRLTDTVMANFLTPKGHVVSEEDAQRPNVDAVRLLGRQLHEHPEACARIASGAHLRDIEVQLRHVTDVKRGFSKLVHVRLSWERDHIAVMSGADEDANVDVTLHREVVRLVRLAAPRALDEEALLFTLKRIAKRATEDEAEEESVLVADAAAEA
jgi:hypothetical protein